MADSSRATREDGDGRACTQFTVRYLGFTLIEEIIGNSARAKLINSNAVRMIKQMSHQKKSPFKKPIKVLLSITSKGIQVLRLAGGSSLFSANYLWQQQEQQQKQNVMIDAPIERISFCASDDFFSNVFAFTVRNRVNETTECHAFSCSSTQFARNLSISVNQAFIRAQQEKCAANQNSLPQQQKNAQTQSSPPNGASTENLPATKLRTPKLCLKADEDANAPPPHTAPILQSHTKGSNHATSAAAINLPSHSTDLLHDELLMETDLIGEAAANRVVTSNNPDWMTFN